MIAARLRGQSVAPASAPTRKLGVALVGLGGYSTGQLGPALRQTKHCRLAGVVTGSREKGEKWARDHGFPSGNIYNYDTMDQLAGNPDIDIVYVVTPNALHAGHVIRAAKAGKHVICEKPMAVSVAECDAMLAACRAAKVKLSIGYRLHFDPYHQELMRLVKEKEFGAFNRLAGDFAFVMKSKVWRADKKLAGGGPLMDLGVYVIQSACMAAGGIAPVAITAAKEEKKTRLDLFPDVEEGISWTMEFPGGVVGEGKTSYARSVNQFRAEAPRGFIELKPAFSYSGLRGETTRGPLRFDPPVNQQARQIDDFAQCVLQNRESRVPGEMGRRDVQIIEAIYASAREGGKRVMV